MPMVPFSRIATNTRISLLLFGLCMLLAAMYELMLHERISALLLAGMALFFLLPYGLCLLQKERACSLVLSILTPFAIISASLLHKYLNSAETVNYFDARIALLFSALLPLLLFKYSERLLLSISLLPSFFLLLFFDPLHDLLGLGYYQQGFAGKSYYIAANLYTLLVYLFVVIALLMYKYYHYQSLKTLARRSNTLKNYLDTLLAISAFPSLSKGDIHTAYRDIAERTKKCLSVSRVSIWHYQPEQDSLYCAFLLDNKGIQLQPLVLTASTYPDYFKTIKKEGLIIAEQARLHPVTRDFGDSYLKPYHIFSMMDAMFHIDGSLAGIICCEQQETEKEWLVEDSIFLRAVADFICLVHNISGRKMRERLLKDQNADISRMNEALEQRVRERTAELEHRNKQLSEYAFINSHMLRAPLARISGLANILQTMPNEQLSEEYLRHLQSSILELEEITHKINQAITRFGQVNRDQLKEMKEGEEE